MMVIAINYNDTEVMNFLFPGYIQMLLNCKITVYVLIVFEKKIEN